VLFLDEVCEFPRDHLEALRQPIEDRRVAIARVRGSVAFPSEFVLVAAANPCPCGHLGQLDGTPCKCTDESIRHYRARLSGPMRDRIDMAVDVPRVDGSTLFDGREGEPTDVVRRRLELARARQDERRTDIGVPVNALIPADRLLEVCHLDARARDALTVAGERWQLSARSYHRVLRVSRTIADLAGDEVVSRAAVIEALQLRGDGV
jgi:magnesium chelatase family protein